MTEPTDLLVLSWGKRTEKCPTCGGYGGTCILIHDGSPHGREHCRGAQWRNCADCRGSGRVVTGWWASLTETPTAECVNCYGDGVDYVVDEPQDSGAVAAAFGLTDAHHCRVCEEPMSDRYTSEQAHQWHEPGCLNGRVFGEEHTNCDCAGYVHPHCCPCDLEHVVEP